LLIPAADAAADVIQLKNGRTLEGKVREAENGQIEIILPYGSLSFSRDLVASVQRGDTIEDEVLERLSQLAPDDADGLYELAAYCHDQSAYTLAGRLLEEVLLIDPDHPEARRDLGYILDDDRWVTEEEYRRRRGQVPFRGSWVQAAERDRILTLESALSDRRRRTEIEQARLELELARLEAELTREQPEGSDGVAAQTLYPVGVFGPLYHGPSQHPYYPPGTLRPGPAHGHPGEYFNQSTPHQRVERQLEDRRIQRAAPARPVSPSPPAGSRQNRGGMIRP
jgi:tetratricopeptide (TPR) repeat protein